VVSLDHLRETYFEEVSELLERAYAELDALSAGRAHDDTIHALFRAYHSIKGGGGAFGFARPVGLAHVMETLLDLIREEQVALAPDLLALLVRGTDVLADLLAAERNGVAAPPGVEATVLQALEDAADIGGARNVNATAVKAAPVHADGWRIEFSPHLGLFRSANEPLNILRELARLGPVEVSADSSRLPPIDRIDPEEAYLSWSIILRASVARTQVEDVFEFVLDDCNLSIEPLTGTTDPQPADADTSAPQPAAATGQADSVTQPGAPPLAQSVRVDVGKIDRLVNLVGELVITQAMLAQHEATLPPDLCPGLTRGLETLSQHLRELQDGVMAIRTQPVRTVFSRMPRLMREVASMLGKDVRLVITGEGTEIDKTVVEQLADPLTHLLRNALDHGIEAPDAREALGKPRQGVITLSAEQRGGRIIIEIADDGRGIDRARVLARARDRGLIPAEATPAEAEIDELIFMPGFSTAETVSAVSGRGVGMDVVRRNIEALGGRIRLDSAFGRGSRVTLTLPLTLAVLDGLVVSVGRDAYIVPIAAIVESLRPRREDVRDVVGHGQVLAIRGSYVPLMPLHKRFGIPGAVTDVSRGIVVIVETDHAGQIGLLVDDLVGQQQVVVKSLEANWRRVEGIGGATILGDGRVALILDVAGLAGPAVAAMPVEAPRPQLHLH
jgi:two-component system chemotaxis sensor kinase CheA